MLDNWYLADPTNQKGQTEYTGTGYTIDRWLVRHYSGGGFQSNVTIRLHAMKCLELINDSDYIGEFQQILENIPEGTYTLSVLVEDSIAGNSYLRADKSPTGATINRYISEGSGLYSQIGMLEAGQLYVHIALAPHAHMGVIY